MAVLPAGTSITASTFEERLGPDAATCDLSGLRFIDAFGLVGTACALLAAGEEAGPPEVVLPSSARSRQHLERMGLIRFLNELKGDASGPVPPEGHEDVVVPLKRVASIFEGEQLSHLIWAQARDWVSPQVLEALIAGVWELLSNATEHSGADAVLMGQVYRHGNPPDHDHQIQIVIGDAGRGIKASFLESGTHAPATDREAIGLSLEYLVSSIPDSGRGQGLTTTVEEVAGLQGSTILRSGAARVRLGPGAPNWQDVLPIKGTIVGISLPLYPE